MEAVILDKLMEIVIEKLIDTGIEYLKDQFRWQTGMKEELERLRGIQFTKIQAVVAYASTQLEIKDQNPALNTWLCLLRNAMDEVEDLLDVFEYMKLEKQLAKKKSKASSIKGKIVKVGQRALKIDPNLKRLEEVVQKLDKVSADVDTFFELVKDAKQEQQQDDLDKTYETARLLPPNSQIIPRDKYKEYLLSNPSNEKQTPGSFDNISLKTIVGHGGMGKTTLLQHVLEDDRTLEFDFKMWVYVSNKFDVNRVIAGMLHSPGMNRSPSPSDPLDKLVISLQSALKTKKFLLVLDDIWNDDDLRDKLEKVLSPLASGSLGSMILVTTRMDHVAMTIASVMGKKNNKQLKLEGLNENECLKLLNNHAFAGVEEPYDREKLRPIAKEIVKKLSGSPLVAKVIGCNLSLKMDVEYWKKVLNTDIGIEAQFQDKVLNVLKRSYIILKRPEQICFAFCSIFPQNHEFDKDDLIRMWIALGFIHPTTEKTGEDIGGECFNVLVNKSLFDKFQTNDNRTYYKMHDLIRELALSVSKQECLSTVGDKMLNSDNPESIRHLSVETSNLAVLRNTKKFKNLRSLFLYYEGTVDLDAEIFKAWRSIRLLYIYAPNQKLTLEPIGHLIHLRYLKLVKTSVTLLPKSLSNLYLLRFIIYDRKVWSFHKNFLPRDINNLNLHHLQLPGDKFPAIHGIGKLSSLQRLDGFYVKNETGYRMEELEHMNKLCQLRIKQLENVKDVGEACSAKLCDKRNLMDLSLEWGDVELRINGLDKKMLDDLISLNEKVLDNLQPHNKLKKLMISGYMGARSAMWMNDVNSISNLEYIQLDHCLQWQTLPPFGQFRILKSLYLRNMQKVESLGYKFQWGDCVFPSLKVLYIEKLEGLEVWFDPAATSDQLFPYLIELYLKDCPNLQELSYLPRKLKVLEIDNIGWKALNWLQDLSSCKISIQNCCNFTENVQLMHSELTINDPSVLLMDPLKRITSLEKLTIKDNDQLVLFSTEAERWFQKVSSSLCELDLDSLKSLQSLPSCLRSLSSLKILRVYNVPQLQELPHLPSSLNYLTIKKCHPALKERYEKSDRDKIAHIRHITISNDQ